MSKQVTQKGKGQELTKGDGITYTFVFSVSDNLKEKVDVKALGTDYVSIFITSDSLERSQELIEEGKEKADIALKEWTPEKKSQTPEIISTEEKEEDRKECLRLLEEYAKSERGQKFLESVRRDKLFFLKKGPRSITLAQLDLLAYIHNNSFINGSLDLMGVGYRRGYDKAKKDLRTK